MRLWTEVGAPYECAGARMGLGDALRAHGNERQAILEFHAAHSTFERLGAEIDIRRAAEAAGDTRPSAGPRMERVFMFTDIVQVHEPGGVHRRRGLGRSGPVAQRPARLGRCPLRR